MTDFGTMSLQERHEAMAQELAQLRAALDVAQRELDQRVVVERRMGEELTLLRELSDDLTRWREAGGDARELRYVLETMDKIEAMKEGEL